MGSRLELQVLLEKILDPDDELDFKPVYFQPPENLVMVYPAIRYQLDDISTEFAGNKPYNFTLGYEVTVIDRNPESQIPVRVAALPMCIFSRFFVAEGLNHSVFTLYF